MTGIEHDMLGASTPSPSKSYNTHSLQVGIEPTRQQCQSDRRGEATRVVSRHNHDFERRAWPLFLDEATPTSQWHDVTPCVGCKSVKEPQPLAFFLSFTHSFITFESAHFGQKYHDIDRQARLYCATWGYLD
jgi:hypothetical protein